MTCRSCRETILDLARNVAMPASIVEAATAHIDGCQVCTAELHRQRELTAALEVLATAAESWLPSDGLEARLLDIFERNRPKAPIEHPTRGAPGRWSATGAVCAGLAAAALIVLALRVNVSERGVVDPDAVKPSEPSQERRIPSSDSVSKTTESTPGPPAGTRTARAGGGRRRTAPVRPVEFIPIPSAAGLPALESGRIVRLELPMSALPAYGVEIVAGGARSSVEADLLVGQDGQARAIRLVARIR